MRVISLWQPWASLIGVGAKTIETRSRRTSIRGRIAIHAAKTYKGLAMLDAMSTIDATIGDYRVSAWGALHQQIMWRDDSPETAGALPLGAIVATADLVDCLPIGELSINDGHINLVTMKDGTVMLQQCRRGSRILDISDQIPYGDWTPGRWAWILENIEPVDPPIPHVGKQGWGWISDDKVMS